MSDDHDDKLHEYVFAAIHALPLPMTQEQALNAGLSIMLEPSAESIQFRKWFEENGARLVMMLNEGALTNE